ncbi:MAG: fibronectin-binding domain-containing protein, partial [Thermoplasmata archaeon]
MKVEMSSFDVLAIVKELQSVVGARVGKIYQVSPHELKIQLNIKNFGNAFLVVEAGRRIHLTEYPKPSPTKPSNFAMSLRKHISGGIIKKIRQINFDRVVELEIEKKNEKYYLICELFGKGNIILTDKNYHILSVMIPRKYKHRELLIRSKYEYPPQKVNPLEVDEKQLKEILKKSTGDIVRTLAVLLGLGGTYAEEVCLRAKIEKNKKELDKEEIKKIIDAIKEINSEIGTKNLIIFDDENAVDATPIFLELYKNKKFLEFDSFNRALDEYYTKYELKKIQEVEKKEFERKIKKIKERLKIQAKTYREFKRKSEKNKKIG